MCSCDMKLKIPLRKATSISLEPTKILSKNRFVSCGPSSNHSATNPKIFAISRCPGVTRLTNPKILKGEIDKWFSNNNIIIDRSKNQIEKNQ